MVEPEHDVIIPALIFISVVLIQHIFIDSTQNGQPYKAKKLEKSSEALKKTVWELAQIAEGRLLWAKYSFLIFSYLEEKIFRYRRSQIKMIIKTLLDQFIKNLTNLIISVLINYDRNLPSSKPLPSLQRAYLTPWPCPNSPISNFYQLLLRWSLGLGGCKWCRVGWLIIIQWWTYMEAQGQVKYSSKISVESRRSQISSCRSLERPPWSDKDHSLTKNRSLIEVMSIESSKKSDLYEKILAENTDLLKPIENNRKSKPISTPFNPFKTCFKAQPMEVKRFSYQQGGQINHICLCYLKCKVEACPCYLALDQECVNELCCKECIQIKSKRTLQSIIGQQKMERIYCTCKKTKCNKKYCSCYAAGIKCDIDCTCEDCLNCDKVERMEVEPVCIVDEEIRNMKMPESMDFEPPSFRYSYNSNS